MTDSLGRKLLWSRDLRERRARQTACVIAASAIGFGFVGMVVAGNDMHRALAALGGFLAGLALGGLLVIYVGRREH